MTVDSANPSGPASIDFIGRSTRLTTPGGTYVTDFTGVEGSRTPLSKCSRSRSRSPPLSIPLPLLPLVLVLFPSPFPFSNFFFSHFPFAFPPSLLSSSLETSYANCHVTLHSLLQSSTTQANNPGRLNSKSPSFQTRLLETSTSTSTIHPPPSSLLSHVSRSTSHLHPDTLASWIFGFSSSKL